MLLPEWRQRLAFWMNSLLVLLYGDLSGGKAFGEIKFHMIRTCYLQAALRDWGHLVLPPGPGAVLYP